MAVVERKRLRSVPTEAAGTGPVRESQGKSELQDARYQRGNSLVNEALWYDYDSEFFLGVQG